MYQEKIFSSILDIHANIFVPYSAGSEYHLDFRSKDKDKPRVVATIYLPSQVKNHKENKKIEKDCYLFHKIDKLTIITYNSIKKINPLFYKNYVAKPMFMTKILQLNDKIFDNFKDWVCKIICVKSPCYCKNKNLVTRYVYYTLYVKVLIKL